MSTMDPEQRARANVARMQYERETATGMGSSGGQFDDAGPPNWNKASWDAFHAKYGYWPYGMQDGGQVLPPTFEGCPDWAYERMGLRRTPITVNPGAA